MDRLDALRAFVRLVELGSFTRVARELRVGQPTVSKWIATLEEQLAVQLLVRTTRSLRVTDAGTLFYEHAREVLASYEAATSAVAPSAIELRGRLRVSLPVVFGRLYVVPHLAELMQRHPQLEIELMFSDRYVRLVEEGFDVALRVGVPVDSGLRSRKLGETARHLVASPNYGFTAPSLDRPRDLATHPCLLHTGLSRGDVWTFRRGEVVERAAVRGRFAANNSEALKTMACAGLGIALLATWLVHAELKSGALTELLPAWKAPPAPIYALMPPARHIHPRVRVFIDFMAERLSRWSPTPTESAYATKAT